jgi:cell cycle checkpoint control protein RAD9A
VHISALIPADVLLHWQSLLSILKHKTVEKTVDRCDLSIVEGGGEPDASADADKEDSLASKLIIRLHCKHGALYM